MKKNHPALGSYSVTHVRQRATKSAPARFTSALKGDSHPGRMIGLIAGAPALARSPFKVRSIMPTCDVRSAVAVNPEPDGAARSESTKFIARTTTMTAHNWSTVRLAIRRDVRSAGAPDFPIVVMTHPLRWLMPYQ